MYDNNTCTTETLSAQAINTIGIFGIVALAVTMLLTLLKFLPAVPAGVSIEQMQQSSIANAQKCAAMDEMEKQGHTPPYTCGK